MRNRFAEVFYKISLKNKKIRLVAADISPAGKLNELSKKYPDSLINVGVAEASMISICAGLAMSGYRPFAYSISTFSLFRPFEMVRVDVGYQNLPVVIVGMGAGTTYSTLGGTHISQEDVSIVRSIPNFIVLIPCDPDELEDCLYYLCNKNNSPAYLRIGKAGEKNFINKKVKWELGKPRQIIKGKKICLLSSGPIIRLFFDILLKLKLKGVYPSIYSFHTLKPIFPNKIKSIFSKYDTIVTLEDMSEINGLASIIKEQAYNFKYKGSIKSFSLQDRFLKNYGSQDDLLKTHGITAKKILSCILSVST